MTVVRFCITLKPNGFMIFDPGKMSQFFPGGSQSQHLATAFSRRIRALEQAIGVELFNAR